MRRTIFTITHAALAFLAIRWCEVLEADEAAAGIADCERDEVQRLWLAVSEFTREALVGLGIPANEYTLERAAEYIWEVLRSDEQLPFAPENDIASALKWVIDCFYFRTEEGRREQGGLQPGEFGLMAEG